MKKIKKILACILASTVITFSLQGYLSAKASEAESVRAATTAYGAIPSEIQLNYQGEELTAFIHFGMNTFTNSEWGTGKESPTQFNPTNLDVDQWIRTLKETGFKKVIFTAKHHDGFVLWPSKTTEHSVKNSPYKNGQGDVVREVQEACKKHGMKLGLYLSPWDMNSPDYGEGRGEDYNDFYMRQLEELLTNYGEIAEIWMDGAKGSNVQQDYDFDRWFKRIKELQPNCIIWSSVGPDARWIGNEKGIAGEPCWSTIDIAKMAEREKPSYLNTGEEGGPDWVVGEADVSIRPQWFYHKDQDNSVKSLATLMNIYFKSIGRNSVLLLNVPPNTEGKIHQNDLNRLKEFGDAIKGIYDEDLAVNKEVVASSIINDTFLPNNLVDGDLETYWAPSEAATTGSFTIDLGEETTFDIINLQEYIKLGQRVAEFKVEVSNDKESWREIFEGKTIGYKRLVRVAPTNARYIRVSIDRSLATPLISNVTVYKSPANIELPLEAPEGLKVLNNSDIGTDIGKFEFSNGWNYEQMHESDINGDGHWTNTTNATVKVRFNGTKFYYVAAKDPAHGIVEVTIDDGEPVEVDLYSSSRQYKQRVYESEDLIDGQHTATIKVTGRKNQNARGAAGHIDAALVLDNGGKGMLEIENVTYNLDESTTKPQFKVVRKGGSEGTIEVNYDTIEGTAIPAEDYVRWSGTLSFGPGETEKIIDMVTIIDDINEEQDEYFYLQISDPTGGGVIGFNSRAHVNIVDNDSEEDRLIRIETSDRGEELHQFNFKGSWNYQTDGAWGRNRDISYSIKFQGSKIKLIGAKDPNHGQYSISIDGGEPIVIDAYSSTRLTEQVIFETEGLIYGEHTITVANLANNPHGGRGDIQINYALVDPLDNGIVEPEVEDNDVNNDGVVNIVDLALVSKYYGENNVEYDINLDGIVNNFEINSITKEILGIKE